MKNSSFILMLLLAVGGCGASDSGTAQAPTAATGPAPTAATEPAPNQDNFHGIAVPADPGAAADATVAGVDTDHNGIRDEIDRYIAQTYGADPNAYSAAQLSAKTKQALLVVSTTDVNAATASVYAEADAGGCLIDKFPSDPATAIRINKDMVLRVFNTQQRQKQFQNVTAAVGQFTRSANSGGCQ